MEGNCAHEKLLRKPIYIQLEDDHPIFWRAYRFNVSKRIGIHACYLELLATNVIKLFNGKYVCPMVMPSNKCMFSNWTEKRMWRDYHPFNRKTKLVCHSMPIPKKLFDAIKFFWVFSILELRFGHHQHPLLAGYRVKMHYGKLIMMSKINDFNGNFFHLALKNTFVEFHSMID